MQLSQGDHGLNLYAADAILRGETPYKDFHWFYGPLMPYYYAAFFTVFGSSVKTALLAKTVLTIACSLVIYLTLNLFTSTSLAVIGGLFFFFFQHDFFYTYNHIGGVFLNLLTIYYFCAYIRHKKIGHLYACFISILLLGMIKLNLGVIALLAVLFCFLVLKKHLALKATKTIVSAIVMLPVGWIILNGYFLIGLPFYIVKQGFQYFGNDAAAESYPSILTTLSQMIQAKIQLISFSPLGIFICICALAGLAVYSKHKNTPSHNTEAFPYIFIFGVFYIFMLHEYILSGVFFREYWADSAALLLAFGIIAYLSKHVSQLIKILIILFLLVQLLGMVQQQNKNLAPFKTFLSHFNYPKGNVYIGNNLEWKETISQTLSFIEHNIPADEMFFAAPYDPLYYYLTDRKSPTRQLVFFDFLNIPEVQQKNIINDLERNNVKWILLSNRVISNEPGNGAFGQTNSQLIAVYIQTHFEKVAEFGQWGIPAGWTWDTGMRIYRRK